MAHLCYYDSSYYSKLKEFYFRQHPERKTEYFDYFMKVIPYSEIIAKNNILVLNDEDEIVGCHLYLPTKAMVKGVEKDVFWGHDTLILEQYRGDLGVELMMEQYNGRLQFGQGYSEVNYKIQRKMKTPILGIAHRYLLWNWKTPVSLFISLFTGSSRVLNYALKHVSSNGMTFDLIDNIEDLKIPNNGYWQNTSTEVEFVRDRYFIEHRFLKNFNKYYFYAHKTAEGGHDAYFVVRVVNIRGLKFLSVVDFRFTGAAKESMACILKAANKISRSNNIPFVYIDTTLDIDKSLCDFKFKDNVLASVMGPWGMKFKNTETVLFTSADTDLDFQRI